MYPYSFHYDLSPSAFYPPSPPPLFAVVGESIRILRSGTDMQKVRKNKLFPRMFFLEEDLSAVAWKSNHKKPNKARSESMEVWRTEWEREVVMRESVCGWKGGGVWEGGTLTYSPPHLWMYPSFRGCSNQHLAICRFLRPIVWCRGVRKGQQAQINIHRNLVRYGEILFTYCWSHHYECLYLERGLWKLFIAHTGVPGNAVHMVDWYLVLAWAVRSHEGLNHSLSTF